MKLVHGGDVMGYKESYDGRIVDFSANLNPFGMPQSVRLGAIEGVMLSEAYPDPLCRGLTLPLSERLGISPEQLVLGNGGADLIFRLVQTKKPEKAIITAPSFSEYADALKTVGCEISLHKLEHDKGFAVGADILDGIKSGIDMLFLCEPNNPTGLLTEPELMERIIEKCRKCGVFLFLDESFGSFVSGYKSRLGLTADNPGMFILGSFTKLYAMAGLRLGYGVSGDLELIKQVKASGQPWPVSTPAQMAGKAALLETEYAERSLEFIESERRWLSDKLRGLGMTVFPGRANYLFFHTDIPSLYEKLAGLGIFIRDCSNYTGLCAGYYRVSVRLREDNIKLVSAIRRIQEERQVSTPVAKSIMVVGTASSAGKSTLVAGLCRVFKQDGHRAAPYKSQNMALNSYITKDGLEMGRAQAVQAEAACIEPSASMNPILLKPTSDSGSQVIVMGEVMDTLTAGEYYKRKDSLREVVVSSYNELASEFDIMVLEGAGSPAEINLKSGDFVNMGMAEIADAPVILVGDIDRGGVFASLYGTVMLMEPHERARIKGVVINKFRGDIEILKPGLTQLEELIGIPVLGVVPYTRLEIEDEDSLSWRLDDKMSDRPVDIAVIRLPRITNFTDFDPLLRNPYIGIRYVDTEKKLGNPDMVIIPGTKNTITDLNWMRQNGIEAGVKKLAASGTPVLGICGGFQMLGQLIRDEQGVETKGEVRGMELLPCVTNFKEQKTRTRVTGTVGDIDGPLSFLSGAEFEGYEIHMGETETKGTVFAALDDGTGKKSDGAVSGNVLGTYVHGIFEMGDAADRLAKHFIEQKGIEEDSLVDYDFNAHKQREYDKLADVLRSSLDMEQIYKIMEK